jgi:hypothetical protein
MEEPARGALLLGNQPAREVERAAGHVRVHVDSAWKNNHAARVEDALAFDVPGIRDNPAAVDADVLDDAVDAVARIVDRTAGNPEHRNYGISCDLRAQLGR